MPRVSILIGTLILFGYGVRTVHGQAHVDELKALQPKIDQAIDKGVQWLVKKQLPDGSWRSHANDYPNGMTSLAVYTLLKCGLPTSDPSVSRGLAWLSRREPRRTYSCGLQMMALEATHNAAYRPAIKRMMELLIGWQQQSGGWGYPDSRLDLSNTQYAALGLRAAMMAGIHVPKEALLSLKDIAEAHQETQQQIKIDWTDDPAKGDGYERSKRSRLGYAAGFSYERGRPPTGSMTAAGAAILLIVRDCLAGRVPAHLSRGLERQARLGVHWLGARWSIDRNVDAKGEGKGWDLYYLYGLERLGSLLGEEFMAGHPWYLEGARHLVKKQGGDGVWNDEPDTSFALLFLKRATWAGGVTGPAARSAPEDELLKAPAPADGVAIAGRGSPVLAMWIDGLGSDVEDRHRAGANRVDLRVARVEYRVGDDLIATVEGDTSRSWRGETFAARHTFHKAGRYRVSARMYVLPPGAWTLDAETTLVELDSASFDVEVKEPEAPWKSEFQRAADLNLLFLSDPEASATSQRATHDRAEFATDGSEATRWICAADDARPQLNIRLRRRVQARYLLLAPVERDFGGENATRATKIQVRIGKDLFTETIPEKGPLRIDLGKPTRVAEIVITILERALSSTRGEAGFTEIYLYSDRP
jgi:hypothetical protein